MFGGGIYLPDPSTYDPIEILLNTYDRSERDELVKIWRDNKLSELNFVGVVLLSKGSRRKKTGRRAPSYFQIMTWQMPVMFLITGTICMVMGMFLLVWSATSHLGDLTKWDDQNKVWFRWMRLFGDSTLTQQ
ncbi:unnamed protein product [Alternaria alternata]